MAAVVHGIVLDVHGGGHTWYSVGCTWQLFYIWYGGDVHDSGCTGGGCTWQRLNMVWWWMYMAADVHGMVVDVHGSGCTWYGGGCTWQPLYSVGSLGSVDVQRATTKVKNKSLINYSLPRERTLSALT